MLLESDEDYDYPHLKSIEKILEEGDECGLESDVEGDVKCELENGLESGYETSKYKLITRRIDSNRIRHKTASNMEIHTSVCKNVRISMDSPIRSGAIIYTHHKGETYFCMGIDSSYGDLTDFAGGVKKTDSSVLHGGLRELKEESLGIFDLRVEEVSESLAFYSYNMLIMFVRMQVDMEKTRKDFSQNKVNPYRDFLANDLEVSDIQWLRKDDFLESVQGKGQRMYSRVRKILSKVTEIISAL